MATSTITATLSKKVGNDLYYIYPKTAATMVLMIQRLMRSQILSHAHQLKPVLDITRIQHYQQLMELISFLAIGIGAISIFALIGPDMFSNIWTGMGTSLFPVKLRARQLMIFGWPLRRYKLRQFLSQRGRPLWE